MVAKLLENRRRLKQERNRNRVPIRAYQGARGWRAEGWALGMASVPAATTATA